MCVCVCIYIFLYIQKYPLFLFLVLSICFCFLILLLFFFSEQLSNCCLAKFSSVLFLFVCFVLQTSFQCSFFSSNKFIHLKMKQQDARTDSISVFDDLPAEENLPSFSLYTYKHTYIFETSVFFVRFGCFFSSSLFYLFKQTKQQICVSFNVHQFYSNENDEGERQMRISNKFQNLFPFLNHHYLCFSIDFFHLIRLTTDGNNIKQRDQFSSNC